MSLLSRLFGKKSEPKTLPVSLQMQIQNENTEALYEEIFDFIEREKMYPSKITANLHGILTAKRIHFPDTNDYLADLIWQIHFYKEMETELLAILERLFKMKYIPKYKQLEKEIVGIQIRIRKGMEGFADTKLVALAEDGRCNPRGKMDYAGDDRCDYHAKIDSEDDDYNNFQGKIAALQADFSERYLKNRLLLELIETLTYGPPLANELFCSSPQFNLDTIKKNIANRVSKYLSGCPDPSI